MDESIKRMSRILTANYSFKKAVYMFEGMAISETIHEGVL